MYILLMNLRNSILRKLLVILKDYLLNQKMILKINKLKVKKSHHFYSIKIINKGKESSPLFKESS